MCRLQNLCNAYEVNPMHLKEIRSSNFLSENSNSSRTQAMLCSESIANNSEVAEYDSSVVKIPKEAISMIPQNQSLSTKRCCMAFGMFSRERQSKRESCYYI